MKTLIVLATLFAATPALAHVGHLAEVAGHGDWAAAATAGAAIAIAIWAGLKGKSKDKAEEAGEDAPDEELQEA